jgi:hypothetical protein
VARRSWVLCASGSISKSGAGAAGPRRRRRGPLLRGTQAEDRPGWDVPSGSSGRSEGDGRARQRRAPLRRGHMQMGGPCSRCSPSAIGRDARAALTSRRIFADTRIGGGRLVLVCSRFEAARELHGQLPGRLEAAWQEAVNPVADILLARILAVVLDQPLKIRRQQPRRVRDALPARARRSPGPQDLLQDPSVATAFLLCHVLPPIPLAPSLPRSPPPARLFPSPDARPPHLPSPSCNSSSAGSRLLLARLPGGPIVAWLPYTTHSAKVVLFKHPKQYQRKAQTTNNSRRLAEVRRCAGGQPRRIAQRRLRGAEASAAEPKWHRNAAVGPTTPPHKFNMKRQIRGSRSAGG